MAYVISVVTLKGGVGKTTISINLGTCLQRTGSRVLLVDADISQPTLSTWAANAAESGNDVPPVVALAGKRLRTDLEQVAKGFDVAIVDSAPQRGPEARAAMISADLVLIPVTPGAPESWALATTLEVLEEARGLRPEIQSRILFNRGDRTGLSQTALHALESSGVLVLDASLKNRVAIGEATAAGQGVVTYAPNSEAATEVRRMTKEILGVLRGK